MNTSKYFRLSWALCAVASVAFLSACQHDTPTPDGAAPGSTPAPVSSANSASSQPSLIETIYVPGTDDKLHPKPVSFKSIKVPASALQEIVSTAPKWFPKGAKINNITSTDKQLTVDVDKKFVEQSFWGSSGEKTAEIAVYSIVNSASGKSNLPVQLTVEGQPMSALGDFDASDAIPPRPELIVGTPPKAGKPSTLPVTDKTPAVPTPVASSAGQAEPTTAPTG